MKTSGNTILITGGGTGIGLALAESFASKGNQILVCGRRNEKLEQVKEKIPGSEFFQCDLTKQNEREALHDWAVSNFSELNILVNNAGIQRRMDFKRGVSALEGEDEIEINLKAPVHLTALFTPDLMKREESAIINVSSGLGFVPLAMFPVYCSTKAAIHLFSVSLRHQLKDTSVKVFEVIPPIVDTELDHGTRDKSAADRSIPPSEVAIATLKGMEENDFEIAVGMAENLRAGSKQNFDEVFKGMNR